MLMDKHAEDALVTGYQHLIPTLQLPDSNDRHVLAAAIHARANVIVTLNLRHFPAVALSPYGVEPKHPDAFIVGLLNRSVAAVVSAAQDHRLSLKNPPRSTAEYLDTLAKQGLAETACILAGHLK